MKTHIYLVRHAESLSNVDPLVQGDNDTLSPLGLEQAEKAASVFKNMKIDKIYTSNTPRAQMTAEKIGNVVGVKFEIHECLKERSGVFSADKVFTVTEVYDGYSKRIDETKKLLENSSDHRIIIVGHAIFLKSFGARLMLGNNFNENLLSSVNDVLCVENAGISYLVFNKEKNKWRILSWNSMQHLEN